MEIIHIAKVESKNVITISDPEICVHCGLCVTVCEPKSLKNTNFLEEEVEISRIDEYIKLWESKKK